MAVELRKTTFENGEVNRLRADVDQAVRALDAADQPNVSVLQAAKSQALTGNEDYVLVDMSGAVQDVYLLLPAPGAMSRAVTVTNTNPGKAKLFVKASDAGNIKINSSTSPVQVTSSVKVIATPTQFYTV